MQDPVQKNKSDNLKNELFDQPWKFSLHQFIFLAQKLNKNFKFQGNISLSTGPSDIIQIEENIAKINGISLLGIQGPLPIYYINMMMDRKRNRDYTLHDFLDIFNNKIVYNTFHIKRKSTFSLTNQQFRKSAIGKITNAIGLGQTYNQYDITKRISTAFPVLLWSQQSPKNLVLIIKSFLKDAKVECKQFLGKWTKIGKYDQTILKSNCNKKQLGYKFLGTKFWNIKQKIQINISTKSKSLYEKLLPEKEMRKELELIIKSYIPYNIKFSIKLNLEYTSQPTILLGKKSILSYFGWLNKDTVKCELLDQTYPK